MQPTATNEAFGDFGLPSRARSALRQLFPAIAFGCALFLVGAQLVTQWLARSLDYQPALGEPVALLGDTPLFAPWAAFGWISELELAEHGATLASQASNWLRLDALLSLAFGLLVFARRARATRNRAAELHGSAKWAARDEIERAGLLAGRGVVAGKWVDKTAGKVRYLRHNGPEHVLAFAPTGSGKGVGLVLPTLLTWTESALVLDPKGENYAKTSGWRAQQGQRVFKLDFAAPPADTAAFNPLSAVRLGTAQETADVQRIARLIVDPDGKQFEGANKHWAETASSLLTGALLHVLYRERLKGRCATLADVVDELSDKHRTHAQVLLDWINFQHDPKFVQGWEDGGAPTATHPVIAASAREQLNREEKERGSVLSSSVTPLALFRDPLLAANTARSDFTIEELMDGDKPMTLYFVLRPDDIHRLRPIVRIILDMMLRRLVQTLALVGGEVVTTHTHKLLLMLDEFPVLGKLDIFSESLAYIRGWGIRGYLICQDYEQLRASYGDRETISSNCQLQLAYAPNKFETAKHLSQMAGTATVLKRARSRSLSLGSFASNRNSESEHEVSRPLLTPDECMRLPGPLKRGSDIVQPGDMLVFFAGSSPIYAQQPLYFKDATLLERSRIPPAPPRPPMPREQAQSAAAAGAIPAPSPTAHVQADQTPETVAAAALVASVASATRPASIHRAVSEFELDPQVIAIRAGASDAQPPEALGSQLAACGDAAAPLALPQAAAEHPPYSDLTQDEPPNEVPATSSKAHIEVVDSRQAQDAMAAACGEPVAQSTHGHDEIAPIIDRVNNALRGHKIKLQQDVDPATAELGPRFLRAYVLLQPGESIASIRRCSEDLAREIGTVSADIHIANVPAKRAVGLDLPIPALAYQVAFEELLRHASFAAARQCFRLGFCAGIDVSGRPHWTDLADMPHLLVAGTTGSGKTVFLRNILLTLLLTRTPEQLRVRLSSSKPNDFRSFCGAPHAADRELARDASEAHRLALDLVEEMEQRYALFARGHEDDIETYNLANRDAALPRLVAVFDEYAEMRASFQDPSARSSFDNAISRLAQKARAAGIHLVLCMQRPDSKAIEGSIKANILHRVALKLPQANDSRVILDASCAESLLGQGDLFYKNADGTIARLQVPSLTTRTVEQLLGAQLNTPSGGPAAPTPPQNHGLDPELIALVAHLPGGSPSSDGTADEDFTMSDDAALDAQAVALTGGRDAE